MATAAIGLVATAISAAGSVAVARAQAAAEDDAARQSAEQQQMAANDEIAALQLEQESADAAYQQEDEARRRELRRTISAQQAAFGAMGVDPNLGSALAVQLGSVGESADEQLWSWQSWDRQRRGRQSQADSISRQRGLLSYASSKRAATTAAALSGAARVGTAAAGYVD